MRLSTVTLSLLAVFAVGLSLPTTAGALASPGAATNEGTIRKTAKAKRLLKSSKWLEQTKAEVLAGVQAREDKGQIPEGATAKFEKAADWNGLFDLAVASYVKNMDESVMDAAIVFYESEKGQEFASSQPEVAKAAAGVTRDWVTETTMGVVSDLSKGDLAEKAKGLFGKFGKKKIKTNETAAIATLRNLCAAQYQVQAGGKIDADADGIGEYGTLGEMTGAHGVRAGFDNSSTPSSVNFSSLGALFSPPMLSPTLTPSKNGIAVKAGYCFLVLLPDAAKPAGFTHETGGTTGPVLLSGGTKSIGVDVSESAWCAYAWPEERGKSGQRAFFANQAGDVLHSSNEVAKWSGTSKPVVGNAAFLGTCITSSLAVGTRGQDGDVWKVAN